MKIFFYIALLFSTSCSFTEKDAPLITYKTKKISEQRFIKKLMFKSYSLYGDNFVKTLHKKSVFENLKQETLSEILENFIVQELSQEKNITIKKDELSNWINNRTGVLDEKELEKILEISKHSTSEWKNEFKNQLLKKKVLEELNPIKNSLTKTNSKKTKKVKFYLLGILTAPSKIEAETIYKSILNRPGAFEKKLKANHQLNSLQWVPENQISFIKKISSLRKGTFSKPFETDWGHLIVKVKKIEHRTLNKKNNASSQMPSEFKDRIRDLKSNSKLKINYKRLYGLNILN